MREGECHDRMGKKQRRTNGNRQNDRQPVCFANDKIGTRAAWRLGDVVENTRIMNLRNRAQRADRDEGQIGAEREQAEFIG